MNGISFFNLVKNDPRNVLVNYIFLREFVRLARVYLTGRLIDIGCGKKPLEPYLSSVVSEHLGMDHVHTPHDGSRVDMWGTAYEIPVGDSEFDSAICTAVLEHLEEPERAIRECYRVLKLNGVAIYSVPFIWHIHEEPRDFYRFTRYGLQYIFEKCGFQILEVKALSGFWVTFGQLFVYNICRMNRGPLRWTGLVQLLGFWVQFMAFVLDCLDRTEQWTWMNIIVVRKPATGE